MKMDVVALEDKETNIDEDDAVADETLLVKLVDARTYIILFCHF